METEVSDLAKIAKANDTFRQSGNGVVFTPGVQMFDSIDGLMKEVRKYDNFSGANDAYGEHDFGSLIWEGKKVLWKIDYYDQTLMYWSDPVSAKCRRVMTVMLAEEY